MFKYFISNNVPFNSVYLLEFEKQIVRLRCVLYNVEMSEL